MLLRSPLVVLTLTPILAGCSFLFNEEEATDAGMPVDAAADADLCATVLPTVEVFTMSELECGTTEIVVPKVNAMAGSAECPLTGLRWTMSHRLAGMTDPEELFSYSGAPQELMPFNEVRVLGGSFEEPVFNVANYHGPTLLEVDVKAQVAGTDQIFQVMDGINDDDFRLRVLLATSEGQGAKIRIFPDDSQGLPNLGPEANCLGPMAPLCQSESALTTIFKDFSTGQIETVPRLMFHMLGTGVYYLDNVSLVNKTSGRELVVDGSFSMDLDSSPWKVNCTGTCTRNTIPIPIFLQEYGPYTLTLRALGTAGAESEPLQFFFEHAACQSP